MPVDKNNNEGWDEWGNYVLKTMEKIEHRVEKCEETVSSNKLENQKDIIELRVKAAIYGAISGIIISAITTIFTGYILYNLTRNPDTHRKPEDGKNISLYYIPERDRKTGNRVFVVGDYYIG